MEYYNFQTEQECQSKIDSINTALGIPKTPESRVITYCEVIPHTQGYAIPKNDTTSQYCPGVKVVENIERVFDESEEEEDELAEETVIL